MLLRRLNVMLTADIARCPGRPAERVPDECFSCARRIQAVDDYVHAVRGIVWMEPTQEGECAERLVTKQEAQRAARG